MPRRRVSGKIDVSNIPIYEPPPGMRATALDALSVTLPFMGPAFRFGGLGARAIASRAMPRAMAPGMSAGATKPGGLLGEVLEVGAAVPPRNVYAQEAQRALANKLRSNPLTYNLKKKPTWVDNAVQAFWGLNDPKTALTANAIGTGIDLGGAAYLAAERRKQQLQAKSIADRLRGLLP